MSFYCFTCETNLEDQDSFANHLQSLFHSKHLVNRNLLSKKHFEILRSAVMFENKCEVCRQHFNGLEDYLFHLNDKNAHASLCSLSLTGNAVPSILPLDDPVTRQPMISRGSIPSSISDEMSANAFPGSNGSLASSSSCGVNDLNGNFLPHSSDATPSATVDVGRSILPSGFETHFLCSVCPVGGYSAEQTLRHFRKYERTPFHMGALVHCNCCAMTIAPSQLDTHEKHQSHTKLRSCFQRWRHGGHQAESRDGSVNMDMGSEEHTKVVGKGKHMQVYKCNGCPAGGCMANIQSHLNSKHRVDEVYTAAAHCILCRVELGVGDLERHNESARHVDRNALRTSALQWLKEKREESDSAGSMHTASVGRVF